jgi:hypothetical protein
MLTLAMSLRKQRHFGEWRTYRMICYLACLIGTSAFAAENVRKPTGLAQTQPSEGLSKPPFVSRESVASLPLFTAETIDEFLSRVGAIPHSQAADIRAAIARAATDQEVLEGLLKRLQTTPVTDVGRHLMILSILGELKSARAVEPLKEFIWNERTLVPPQQPGEPGDTRTSFFNHDGALRARAAEMLAYIGGRDADVAVLEIAARHPGAEVRIAAIDAYLFNHADSAEAKEELAKFVRTEERKLIGIPRFKRGMDVRQFDQLVADFYRRYPEEIPQWPKRIEEQTLQQTKPRSFPERPPAEPRR